MSEILNHINGFLPVYRVLNREENLDFFRDVLGLKVLLEEGAMVFLGGHESKKRRLVLEESPGHRTVKGDKKHAATVLVGQADEVAQLLVGHLDAVSKVFFDGQCFGFEAISPENDVFQLLSEGLSVLTEVEKEGVRKKSVKKSEHQGLSEVRVMTLELNSSNGAVLDFVGALLGADVTRNQLRLPFVKMIEHEIQGVDLAARADETLDLELLYFSVDDAVDLVEFSKKADEKSNPYLDQSKRTLSIEAPNHMEVWFVKA